MANPADRGAEGRTSTTGTMAGAHPSHPAGTRWEPDRYHKFADHRLRPALELLARVPIADASLVYDLGCGSGSVTRVIAERFAAARVTGIDVSGEMLARATETQARIEWIQADIASWEPEQAPDLIYANAALHWVDDHVALIPRLFRFLAPGGCLAAQMPLSFSLPSHVLMRETLADGGVHGSPLGDEALAAAVARKWVLDPGEYYDLLASEASSLDVWETEYLQRLEGEDPILEWVEATGLRPILNGLDGADRERFIEVYRERLRAAYPRRADGHTLYPFRRLFMVATRRARGSTSRRTIMPDSLPVRALPTRPFDGPTDRTMSRAVTASAGPAFRPAPAS